MLTVIADGLTLIDVPNLRRDGNLLLGRKTGGHKNYWQTKEERYLLPSHDGAEVSDVLFLVLPIQFLGPPVFFIGLRRVGNDSWLVAGRTSLRQVSEVCAW